MLLYIGRTVVHLASLIPCVFFFYLAIIDRLGADPVKEIIHFTGIAALNILIITLCVSPLAKWLKWGWLIQLRRPLGLYAFLYASLHLVSYFAFELGFVFSTLLLEIIKRPYILVGMAAFSLLTMMAVTSIVRVQRKLGSLWVKLHQWVYLVILLVPIHFLWSVKTIGVEPIFYFFLCVLLLFVRWKKVLKALKVFRILNRWS